MYRMSLIQPSRIAKLLLLPALALCGGGAPASSQTAEPGELFERKIRPLFDRHCLACHNSELATAGLDLSTAEGFRQGVSGSPLISAESPSQSRLLRAVRYQEAVKMPPAGKLDPPEIADLETWIRLGAPWPEPSAEPGDEAGTRPEGPAGLWSLQPVADPEPPPVTPGNRARTPIDRFILAKLDQEGLEPAPPADKLTLLRRATFDLTGLPPAVEDIERFLNDTSPDAFDKVVGRLLDSPRYGEHWARHWLDVARYADSTGNDEDHRYPDAWRYRDYVIDVFNRDLPYDDFILEQIAGDLLPKTGHLETDRRRIIATGFLALGPKAIAQQDKTRMLYDVFDEQLDVVSKSILGLSITCARCHDHKFDPILTRDYYSLISIFASTRSFVDPTAHVSEMFMKPLVLPEEHRTYVDHKEKIDARKQAQAELVEKEQKMFVEAESRRLADYMLAAHRVYAQGADPGELSRKLDLREPILERWAGYLKPDQGFRPHLLAWRRSGEDQRPAIAKDYQGKFRHRFHQRNRELEDWRQRVEKAEPDEAKEDRPKFIPGRDRFFFEVYLQGKPRDKDYQTPFVLKASDSQLFSEEHRAAIDRLQKEIEGLEQNAPPEPDMANAVEDGEVVDQKIFVRGDPGNPGEDAPKASPKVFDSKCRPMDASQGSGRLELARWLIQPEHPLTARVMVNRVWQWHFGQGLVRTPDNFGARGEAPTHPRLLDFLARTFRENGWSLKALHRLIMQSRAYQMASSRSELTARTDPRNLWVSHFPRRRLKVEEIRDGMLALDDSLDLKMGGTLQSGAGFQPENSSDRLSLDPETVLLRTVYLPLRRANLPPLLNLFDFGDATTSSGERLQTNVAPQALFMLNSQFVETRSRKLAELLLKAPHPSDRERLKVAYLRTLSRYPQSQELDLALGYIQGFQERAPGAESRLQGWQSYCKTLLSSNGFIYVD